MPLLLQRSVFQQSLPAPAPISLGQLGLPLPQLPALPQLPTLPFPTLPGGFPLQLPLTREEFEGLLRGDRPLFELSGGSHA